MLCCVVLCCVLCCAVLCSLEFVLCCCKRSKVSLLAQNCKICRCDTCGVLCFVVLSCVVLCCVVLCALRNSVLTGYKILLLNKWCQHEHQYLRLKLLENAMLSTLCKSCEKYLHVVSFSQFGVLTAYVTVLHSETHF